MRNRRVGQSASLLRFTDARLCLGVFRTNTGKVWLTTPDRLVAAGLISSSVQLDLLAMLETSVLLQSNRVTEQDAEHVRRSLSLESGATSVNRAPRFIETRDWVGRPQLASALQRLVVVDEATILRAAGSFISSSSHISIDGKTGAALNGSLFALETIQPDSLFSFDVSFVDPSSLGVLELLSKRSGEGLEALRPTIDTLDHLLLQAFEKAARLGIGGKRNRGMGRVRIWPVAWRKEESADSSFGLSDPKARPLVFISHSSVNKQIARRLANDFQIGGCRVWLDEHEILVGDSVHRKLGEGLEEAEFVILLMSESAVTSPWVRDEIEATLAREKSTVPDRTILLPAMVEDVAIERIPTMIRTRRWATLNRSYYSGVTDLLKSISVHTRRRQSA